MYRINTQNVGMKVILSGGRENDGGFRFSKHSFKNLNVLTLSSVHSQRKLLVSCNYEKRPKIIPIARENRVIGLKYPLHHFKARVLATNTMDSHRLCRNPLQMPLKNYDNFFVNYRFDGVQCALFFRFWSGRNGIFQPILNFLAGFAFSLVLFAQVISYAQNTHRISQN